MKNFFHVCFLFQNVLGLKNYYFFLFTPSFFRLPYNCVPEPFLPTISFSCLDQWLIRPPSFSWRIFKDTLDYRIIYLINCFNKLYIIYKCGPFLIWRILLKPHGNAELKTALLTKDCNPFEQESTKPCTPPLPLHFKSVGGNRRGVQGFVDS